MAGSEAEERIRAKAEAMLRRVFPDARIIHELVLRQGGVRIDLAAVTPDRLVCVEVKSERDVLTRLPEQVKAMKQVCDAWRVMCAEKHVKACRDAGVWNVMAEDDEDRYGSLWREAMSGLCNAPARLDMLWAEELRWIAGTKAARRGCTQSASDSLSGSQVRRAVCAALRSRSFPRADPVIPLEVFSVAA